jgi:hypothetical protein
MLRPAREGITVSGFRNRFSESETAHVKPAWFRVFPEPEVAEAKNAHKL